MVGISNSSVVSILAQIVITSANNINKEDIDEYEDGMYSLFDIPADPILLDVAKKTAMLYHIQTEFVKDDYLKIYYFSKGKYEFIRFNLIDYTDKTVKKGEINSLDMSKSVYNKVFKIMED